jgi:SSS family solute:Na+ symporter
MARLPLLVAAGTQLTALDLAIVALYFLGTFAIGFYFMRRGRSTSDYFLAGRDAAWWAVGASLFSSNIGSEHFIGLAGSGAASGIAVGHFTILAGFLKILPVIMLVVPGMIARALYPSEMAADSNSAFPLLVVRLMPSGLVGLMVAAMLAALMSSLSAVFNSSSTIFTMDFYRHLRPQAGERELVNVGRAATTLMVALGLLWIPFMGQISSQLWVYLQSLQAYVSPPIAAVFLLGVVWKRANGAGALASLLAGFVLGAARFVLELSFAGRPMAEGLLRTFVRMNFLHFAGVVFLVCVGVLAAVSLATAAPAPAKVAGLTFATVEAGGAVAGSETPAWRRRNAVLSGILAATIVCLWIYFR